MKQELKFMLSTASLDVLIQVESWSMEECSWQPWFYSEIMLAWCLQVGIIGLWHKLSSINFQIDEFQSKYLYVGGFIYGELGEDSKIHRF